MTFKQQVSKWILMVVVLLFLQTVTYLFLGQSLLKNKLLPEYFAGLTHHSDSVFVRDFFVTQCATGIRTYMTHELSRDENFLKEKFGVHHVFFQKPEEFSWEDTTSKKFNLVYYTWADRGDYWNLFDLFNARQSETLLVDKKYGYERQVTYKWCLFFWIKTFEWFQSWDIPGGQINT